MDVATLAQARAAGDRRYSRPVGRTAVVYGDSWAALARSTSGTLGSYGYTPYNPGNAWFTWLQAFSGQAFHVLKYAGVTGQTTAQILARWDADVAPYRPDWIFLSSPGINDNATGVALATTQANLTAIFEKAKAIGAHVVIINMPPKSAPVWTAGQLQWSASLNNWLRLQGLGRKALTVVDAWSVLALGDSTSNWISAASNPLTYTADGTHLALLGASRVGKAAWDAIKSLISQPSMSIFGNQAGTGGNYITNAGATTATGGSLLNGATGAAPGSWSVRSTDNAALAGTVTASVVTATSVDPTDVYGRPWLKIVTTGAASKTKVGLNVGSALSDFVVGDTMQGSAEVAFGPDVVVNTSAVGLRCGFYNASFQNVYGEDLSVNTPSGETWPTELGLIRLKLRTPPVSVLSGITGAYLDMLFGGLGTFYFRYPELRRNAPIGA